jgi:acyl carrier protein
MSVVEDEIVAILKSLLLEEMEVRVAADRIDGETPLLEDGLGLDSIVIVELIAGIERKFSMEFQDSDLRTANFSNLNALAEVVRRSLDPARG